MRKILISFLLVGCCSANKLDRVTTVPINQETGKVDFSSTISIDNTKQLELYSRSREWFAKSFVSSKAVLEMDDKEAGKLIGKGYADTPELGKNCVMYFLLSVYVKDDKYRYSFSDIRYEFDELIPFGGGRYQKKTLYAEEIITPNKISNCACMVSRARIKFRDKTIAVINMTSESLKLAMGKKSSF